MKKSIILSALVLPAVFLIFSSNSNGPATAGNGIRNGGPSSNGTCGSCHSGGAGTTTISITLAEKTTGTPASGVYKPGVVYTVTLSGNNPNLAFFGFQLSAATAASQQAGSFGNLGADKHISMQSNLQIVEHSTNLAKTNGNYVATFDWTAPAAGKGSVTFYGIINAVNDNNQSTGDKTSAPSALTLAEQAGPTSIDDITEAGNISVYPNPATDALHISGKELAHGQYTIRFLDITGKVIFQTTENISTGKDVRIAIQALEPGMYLLSMDGNNHRFATRFVKK